MLNLSVQVDGLPRPKTTTTHCDAHRSRSRCESSFNISIVPENLAVESSSRRWRTSWPHSIRWRHRVKRLLHRHASAHQATDWQMILAGRGVEVDCCHDRAFDAENTLPRRWSRTRILLLAASCRALSRDHQPFLSEVDERPNFRRNKTTTTMQQVQVEAWSNEGRQKVHEPAVLEMALYQHTR